MIDINLIRKNTEEVKKALLKRMDEVDFSSLLEWDDKRKDLKYEIDNLRAKRNKVSKEEIPNLKAKGKDITDKIEEMKEVSRKISELEKDLNETKNKINKFLEKLPNIPEENVPPGGKDNNQVERVWGEKPEFEFEIEDHKTIAERMDIIDYERGAKIGGNGFWVYKDIGALLEWGLLNYFIKKHRENGYTFILPPHILKYQCGFNSGQFPKFEDDVLMKL
ncbi:MAG: hypothetical protein ACOC1K_00640 [Nanoarchaeota archaeon]